MHQFYKPEEHDESDEDINPENGGVDFISDDDFLDTSDYPYDNYDLGYNGASSEEEFQDDGDGTSDDSESSENAAGPSGTRNTRSSNLASEYWERDQERRHDLEDDDDDDVVRAIKAANTRPSNHPPNIITDAFINDISFHPDKNLLAVGTMDGDVIFYKYTNEENTKVNELEVHTKSIRDIEFSTDGSFLFSTSRDKSIMLTDTETGKLKRFYDDAHEVPIYTMTVLNENLIATGDDDGYLKVWDIRDNRTTALFEVHQVEDYISCILTNEQKKMLVFTSGDGYLTSVNIGARKMDIQSEPYQEELTCMGLFRSDQKLVVGTSKGRLYSYNWGEFGIHSDMYPGPKSPITKMIPATDRIAICAGEEGIIRAMHVMPCKNLGVVGQHALGVEAMDINGAGDLIASSSHDNDIRFWNINYFEDFEDIKYKTKRNDYRELRHNLPSSQFTNASDFFSDLA